MCAGRACGLRLRDSRRAHPRNAGASLSRIALDTLRLHALAHGGPQERYNEGLADARALPNPGDFHFRSSTGDRELHLNDPIAIAKLQVGVVVLGCVM